MTAASDHTTRKPDTFPCIQVILKTKSARHEMYDEEIAVLLLYSTHSKWIKNSLTSYNTRNTTSYASTVVRNAQVKCKS